MITKEKTTDLRWQDGVLMQAIIHRNFADPQPPPSPGNIIIHYPPAPIREWRTWEPVPTQKSDSLAAHPIVGYYAGSTTSKMEPLVGNDAPQTAPKREPPVAPIPQPEAPAFAWITDEQIALFCDLCAGMKSIDCVSPTSADYMRLNALALRAMATFPLDLWEQVVEVFSDPMRETLFKAIDDLRAARDLEPLPPDRRFWSAPGIADPRNQIPTPPPWEPKQGGPPTW